MYDTPIDYTTSGGQIFTNLIATSISWLAYIFMYIGEFLHLSFSSYKQPPLSK